ncbi:hypothetical protein A9Q83_16610 [Alphaproteobacteria bacterium 46_93_T64]|nr:hypothetical protein A9Q83_16610 [Alphaproteobacteria bacterium 46_93_T64]
MVGRPKGQPKTGGRKKGSLNRINGNIKKEIQDAFFEAGGKDYLLTLSKTDPRAFLSLVGKVIPTEIKAEIKSSELSVLMERINEQSKILG